MGYTDPTINNRYIGDDGYVYTASGYRISGSNDHDYSGLYDRYNKEATQAARDEMYEERMRENLAYNIGPNWENIYDFETKSYKDGYSAADGDGGRLAILAQGGPDIGPKGGGGSNAYQNAYNAQLEAERARIQAQVDQAVNRLNAQKNTVDQQFTDAARQAYIQKMNSEKNLGQQMTAAGLSGGLTESSRLALESGYGNNLNSLTQSRDNALNEIDSSINDVKATGDISIAEAENQFALAQAQEAAAALERQQEIANQKTLMEYEYQLKDQYDRSSGTGGTGSSSSQKNYYNRILGTPKLKDITDRIQEQYDQYGVKYSDDALKYDLQSLYNGGFITGDELGALAYLYNIPVK